jgi:hypothetical protein
MAGNVICPARFQVKGIERKYRKLNLISGIEGGARFPPEIKTAAERG